MERLWEKATTGLGMGAREGFTEEMKDKVKILESWRLGEDFQEAHERKDVAGKVNGSVQSTEVWMSTHGEI